MTMWGSAVGSRWCSQYIGIRTRFCPVSAETGCGGLHKNIIADVRPETRAWPNRENWEGWHQSDQTGNMSKRRGEWHISSFSECDGWGKHDTLISLLLITYYLVPLPYCEQKYTHCFSSRGVNTSLTQNLEKTEPTCSLFKATIGTFTTRINMLVC